MPSLGIPKSGHDEVLVPIFMSSDIDSTGRDQEMTGIAAVRRSGYMHLDKAPAFVGSTNHSADNLQARSLFPFRGL